MSRKTLWALVCVFFLNGIGTTVAWADAGSWTLSGALSEGRSQHMTTLLPSGKVLVTGGGRAQSAEIYDPATGEWSAAAAPEVENRRLHSATLLPSGEVLVAGGIDLLGIDQKSVELYDPKLDAWRSAAPLSNTHRYHTATLLPSGKVVVVGGAAEAEVYDPSSNRWSQTGPMVQPRKSHTATRLLTGEVLVVGGNAAGDGGAVATVEIYDPQGDGNGWSETAPLPTPRVGHTATLLPSGKVLVTGGTDGAGMVTTAELYDPASGSWSSAGSPATPRQRHTATLLPSGKVLVVGGDGNYDADAVYLSDAELYDPSTDTWSPAASLNLSRYDATAVLLASGRVLLVGGYAFGRVTQTELYDPGDGSWQPATALFETHLFPTSATLLPATGKVLLEGVEGLLGVAGGRSELYDPVADALSVPAPPPQPLLNGHATTLLASGKVLFVGGGVPSGTSMPMSLEEYLLSLVPQTTCLVYDPANDTWTVTGALHEARVFPSATLLPSGEVLVVGGLGRGPESSEALGSAELYDPASGEWELLPELLNPPRWFHSATLLPSGEVLVVGGEDRLQTIADADLYDPVSRTWRPTSPLTSRSYLHSATLLPSGKVLVAGGSRLRDADLYDPATGTWSVTGPLATVRFFHTATLLPSGQVLFAGGASGLTGDGLASAELYEPATGVFLPALPLEEARALHAATLLPSGEVLVTGGYRIGGFGFPESVTSAERYLPDRSQPARRPSLTTVPLPPEEITYGDPLTVTGEHLTSPWEVSQGTFGTSASSHPLLQLRDVAHDQIVWIPADGFESSWDDPSILTVSRLPETPVLSPGWHLLTATTAGIVSEARFVKVACGLVIDEQPQDQDVDPGETAVFTVKAQGGRAFRWFKDGELIPDATGPTYAPKVTGEDSGSVYSVEVDSGCRKETSQEALLTIFDEEPPQVWDVQPNGGEFWLLSETGAVNTEPVAWAMSDNVRICQVEVSLLASDDGAVTWREVPAGGGLPAVFGPGGTCKNNEQVADTNLTYTVPFDPPSGVVGSLYKIRVVATDHAGREGMAESLHPFFIVSDPRGSVKTLIFTHLARLGETPDGPLALKLRELADHPRVQGRVVDLGGNTDLSALYAAWDADPADPDKANAVLFDPEKGLRKVLDGLLAIYTGVESVILVGDDFVIPMTRMRDGAVLLPESTYTDGPDLTAGTTVGQALAADHYLSDDPLVSRTPVDTDRLDDARQLFLPGLAVGRLVETPAQIAAAVAVFLSQDGVLDLAGFDHRTQVTAYDFLVDSGKRIRDRWRSVLGDPAGADPLAPLDAELLGQTWGEDVLLSHLCGNGGTPYGVLSLNGHATHHQVGVPGATYEEILGLSASKVDAPGACGPATPLDLAGSVVYSVGCHGGLPVSGSDPADRPLDLPEALLQRGALAYVANSGYGWGLEYGVGYSERLVEILTEELTRGGNVGIGDAIRVTKERYFLENPLFDPYDVKVSHQWTLFGFPMYEIDTGIVAESARTGAARPPRGRPEAAVERFGPVVVRRSVVQKSAGAQPSHLTQLNLAFDFSAPGVYTKYDATGERHPGPGCTDDDGCYYTLNGVVERSTGSTELPIEPYFVFDSRLSGTSQHGVLWTGGTYRREEGWKAVVAKLVSNGGANDDQQPLPRRPRARPRVKRVTEGEDELCRPSDRELNTLVVPTGGAERTHENGDFDVENLFETFDLEAFYFNDPERPADNCDRDGPRLAPGPHHQLVGPSTVEWAVDAEDESGVWRVMVVYDDGTRVTGSDGVVRGTWQPLELTLADDGTWRGGLRVDLAAERVLVYYLQAVDRRGNVTWLDFVGDPDPSSGVPLDVPLAVEVELAPAYVDLKVTLADDPDPVVAGETLVYLAEVTNLSPEAATSVELSLALPGVVRAAGIDDWSCQTSDEELTCRRQRLETVSRIFVFVAAPQAPGAYTATARVEAAEIDPYPKSNFAATTTEVVPPGGDPPDDPPGDPSGVFADGFETGDTSRWSGAVVTIRVEDETRRDATRWRGRFTFDPETLGLSGGGVLVVEDRDGDRIVSWALQRWDDRFLLLMRDPDGGSESGLIELEAGLHRVEIEQDEAFELRIDGALVWAWTRPESWTIQNDGVP